MKDEVFNVTVQYKGQEQTVTVKADLPFGPEPLGSDYDIYIGRKYIYTLNQCRNEDDIHCWEIRKKGKTDFEPEFAYAIGEAIDKHYR